MYVNFVISALEKPTNPLTKPFLHIFLKSLFLNLNSFYLFVNTTFSLDLNNNSTCYIPFLHSKMNGCMFILLLTATLALGVHVPGSDSRTLSFNTSESTNTVKVITGILVIGFIYLYLAYAAVVLLERTSLQGERKIFYSR